MRNYKKLEEMKATVNSIFEKYMNEESADTADALQAQLTAAQQAFVNEYNIVNDGHTAQIEDNRIVLS